MLTCGKEATREMLFVGHRTGMRRAVMGYCDVRVEWFQHHCCHTSCTAHEQMMTGLTVATASPPRQLSMLGRHIRMTFRHGSAYYLSNAASSSTTTGLTCLAFLLADQHMLSP